MYLFIKYNWRNKPKSPCGNHKWWKLWSTYGMVQCSVVPFSYFEKAYWAFWIGNRQIRLMSENNPLGIKVLRHGKLSLITLVLTFKLKSHGTMAYDPLYRVNFCRGPIKSFGALKLMWLESNMIFTYLM